jgi:type I restriction enzyme S subunit
MSDLPKGWETVQVKEVLNLINGYAFKPSQWAKVGLPIIRIQNLNNPNATFNYCSECLPEKYRVRKGDLLFAWSGTPGTSFGAHIWQGNDAWLNQHIFRVEADVKIFDKTFLKFSINKNLAEYISQAHGGAGLAHITKAKFEISRLIIPPLNEQRRIVTRLEKFLGKVQAVQARLDKIPAILKRFRQAVLAAACSGKLTADWRLENTKPEPASELFLKISEVRKRKFDDDCRLAISEGRRKPKNQDTNKKSRNTVSDLPEIPDFWQYFRLEELSYLVTDGTHHTPTYISEGTPFLSVKNVRPFLIRDNDIKFISKEQHNEINQRCNPEKGDILYTKVGATYGYAAVNNLDYDFSIFVSLALIKPVMPFFDSKYAELVMNSEVVFSQARERVTGIGTPDLHLIEIRDFRIPLPPIEEQKEIVRRVEDLFKFADQIEARYKKARSYTDKLTQSILAKAFRGELVPQDERDEPASVLLARIKTEKETNQTKMSNKRKTVSQAGLFE